MKQRSTTLRTKATSGRNVAPLRRVRATALAAPPTVVGRLAGVGPRGEVWIDVPAAGLSNALARTTVPLSPQQVGRELLVTFITGASDRPVVLGVLREPGDPPAPAPQSRTDAIVDGERIVLTGSQEVVLRCGKASIALTADGKVIIKGAKLLASASGLHRIRGGAVQIN